MCPTDITPCWIYRSPRKDQMYLYLAAEDDFERIPAALLQRFGTPQRIMQLDLHAQRPLARADVHLVIADLHNQGFHLQMPPKLVPAMYYGNED